MGPISRGRSCGSYSRSASCTTTTSPLASAKPRCSAAPFPRFTTWRRMRTWVRPSGSAEVTSEGSFSTGKQKLIDTQGRIDRFQKKYANAPKAPPRKAKAAAEKKPAPKGEKKAEKKKADKKPKAEA